MSTSSVSLLLKSMGVCGTIADVDAADAIVEGDRKAEGRETEGRRGVVETATLMRTDEVDGRIAFDIIGVVDPTVAAVVVSSSGV